MYYVLIETLFDYMHLMILLGESSMRWFYDLNGDVSSESIVQYSVTYKSFMSFEYTAYKTLFNFPNFSFAYFSYFLTFNRFIYIIEILDCLLCTSSKNKIINEQIDYFIIDERAKYFDRKVNKKRNKKALRMDKHFHQSHLFIRQMFTVKLFVC